MGAFQRLVTGKVKKGTFALSYPLSRQGDHIGYIEGQGNTNA